MSPSPIYISGRHFDSMRVGNTADAISHYVEHHQLGDFPKRLAKMLELEAKWKASAWQDVYCTK